MAKFVKRRGGEEEYAGSQSNTITANLLVRLMKIIDPAVQEHKSYSALSLFHSPSLKMTLRGRRILAGMSTISYDERQYARHGTKINMMRNYASANMRIVTNH